MKVDETEEKQKPFELMNRLIAMKMIKESIEKIESVLKSNGYLKSFLQPTLDDLNKNWDLFESDIAKALSDNEIAIDQLIRISAY